MFGYNGKILEVDLSTRLTKVHEYDEKFYRKYMGGGAIGGYFLLKEVPAKADPLGRDNVLVLAASVVTGAPISGFSRANVTAKSPITGGIGDAQFGGTWPTDLKRANFDAIIIKGISEKPVYLWIYDGNVEINDATDLWGLEPAQVEEKIRKKVNDKKARLLTIGVAGEKMVKYACIMNENIHAAGRTGMGAVMGSKKLKAVVVSSKGKKLNFLNSLAIRELAKEISKRYKASPGYDNTTKMGSSLAVGLQNAIGYLPTKNFTSGVFDKSEDISGEKIFETFHTKQKPTCYACVYACKHTVKADKPYNIDERYGCPEYETAAALGAYVMVDDVNVVCKANEMCNRYGLDTISTGAVIAFVMECFGRGLITSKESDGLDLSFGNGVTLLKLIEKIAHREGFGDLLAEGVAVVSQKIGKGSESFAMHVKGNPFPAHMPRVMPSLALAYAINSFGADHMVNTNDSRIAPSASEKSIAKINLRSLGLLEDFPAHSLEGKARFFYYTQNWCSMRDVLELCSRAISVFYFQEIVQTVENCTGWKTSLWELLKVGERRTNLLRSFNAREGFTSAEDILPMRVFEPLKGGPTDGLKIDQKEFEAAKKEYYQLAGWDEKTGNPTIGKLKELGLNWVADLIKKDKD